MFGMKKYDKNGFDENGYNKFGFDKFGYNKQITIAEMYRNMDEDLKFLADYFYENVFKPYTMKQWGVDEDALPDCADTYYPFYVSLDDRYYKEKYVAIPETGWTELIENILKSNKNIKLKLNTDFSDINPAKFDRIFFTGSIDEYFDYKHGELPYRSVRMEIDSKIYQPDCHSAAYNWPYEYDFIRAHIFADYIPDKSYSGNKDIIGYEYVEKFELGKNERFYPVNNIVSNEIFAKYAEDASALENVYFAGRLGEFKYYESDELVRRAFETVASLMRKNEIVEEIVEIVEDFINNDYDSFIQNEPVEDIRIIKWVLKIQFKLLENKNESVKIFYMLDFKNRLKYIIKNYISLHVSEYYYKYRWNNDDKRNIWINKT